MILSLYQILSIISMYDIKPTSYILRHFLCQCGISYPCLVPISADDVCAVSIDIELVLVAAQVQLIYTYQSTRHSKNMLQKHKITYLPSLNDLVHDIITYLPHLCLRHHLHTHLYVLANKNNMSCICAPHSYSG